MGGPRIVSLSEFQLIDNLLKPLSAGAPGAFSLSDDTAVLPDPADGMCHVVTKDVVSVGRHMRADDPPDTMARKALRVNLSDLASMGAEPVGFFMALCLSPGTSDQFLRSFVDGLALDVEAFSMPLMGGDIIKIDGPFTVSVTAVGSVEKESVLRRSGASSGEALWVSGTIGDGMFGLRVLDGQFSGLSEDLRESLIERYRMPDPRLLLGQSLCGLATACIDISDGLVADVGHLCAASQVGCRIAIEDVPLSEGASQVVIADPELMMEVLTKGDDYELAWTIPPELESRLSAIASAAGVPATRIGTLTEDREVCVIKGDGDKLTIAQGGYRHI